MKRTAMSDRDLMRVGVLSRMVSGELTSAEGAELLAVSLRQAKRLKKRFVAGGAKGIRHGLLARPSNRQRADTERARVLEIVRERYGGSAEKGAGQRFGPTLAAEQLLEDEGLVIPVSTLRCASGYRGLQNREFHYDCDSFPGVCCRQQGCVVRLTSDCSSHRQAALAVSSSRAWLHEPPASNHRRF